MTYNELKFDRKTAIQKTKDNIGCRYYEVDLMVNFIANYLTTHKDILYVGSAIDYDNSLKTDWTIIRIESHVKITHAKNDGLYSDKGRVIIYSPVTIKGKNIVVDGVTHECTDIAFLSELQQFIVDLH